MESLLKDIDLKSEIKELLDCYFDPPFDWKVYRLGFFKYNGELDSFCNYIGQGVPEPIYNGTAEYIIDILDDIKSYFDISSNIKDYTKEDIDENIEYIYENVLEQIKDFEQ